MVEQLELVSELIEAYSIYCVEAGVTRLKNVN